MMNRENLTDFIKKGFDNKEIGDYKTAIDYFYKALAIDNSSVEIMGELALLYSNLCQYDRAISFYEQEIKAKVLNGRHKGETIVIENEYYEGEAYSQKYNKNDE